MNVADEGNPFHVLSHYEIVHVIGVNIKTQAVSLVACCWTAPDLPQAASSTTNLPAPLNRRPPLPRATTDRRVPRRSSP